MYRAKCVQILLNYLGVYSDTMETKRKVGITLCSVSLGIEVLLLGAAGFCVMCCDYVFSLLFALLSLAVGGLCIAMIVLQCVKSSPNGQLIMSIIALVGAVLQLLCSTGYVVFTLIFYIGWLDSFVISIWVIIVVICILVVIAVVVMLSVNVKMAYDINRAVGAPNQSVVYVTAEDGAQQAMIVQQMS
eukprot:sb/3471272/